MYQLMIVDDESKIRRGLSKYVDWEALDCQVMDVATNGEEAIRKINAQKPDIILTDIRMPLLNGLELAQYIYEEKLGIQMIILTGFADFDYSKKAIAYDVVDFVLKPSTPSTIMAAVAKAKERIKKLEKMELRVDHLESEKQVVLGKLFDYLLQKRMKGIQGNEDFFLESLSTSQQEFLSAYYILRLDMGREVSQQGNDIANQMERYAEDIFHNPYHIFMDNQQHMNICVGGKGIDSEEMKRLCQELMDTLTMFHGWHIRIGLSNLHSGIEAIHKAYDEALEALEQGFYHPLEGVYHYGMNGNQGIDHQHIEGLRTTLEDAMVNNQHEEVLAYIHQIFEALRLYQLRRGKVRDYALWLITLIMERSGRNLNLEQKDAMIAGCHDAAHIGELEELICKCYEEHLYPKSDSYDNYLVDLVNEHIAKHYKEHITLSSISKSLSVNHSYLSRLYKKITHKNLTTSINQYRIQKARKLLQTTDMKVYEIAHAVGIEDATYFSQLFKKYTQANPSDFR